MKFKFPNRLLLLLLGVSCVALSVPVTQAKDEKAPAKEKASAKGEKTTPKDAKKAAAAPKTKHKKGPALTAASLITDMRKAQVFIAKSAKDKISRKSKQARPFWSAVEDSSKALTQIEKGQKAKTHPCSRAWMR